MKIKGKDDIADAALDIIAFEGIDRLTMSVLAERLDVNKASIYHWFKAKEDILEHIFHIGHRRLMAKGFRLSLEGSIEEVLSRAADGWSRIFSSDDTLPYLRAVYSLRYSDERAGEEARAIRLMIRSQIDVLISSRGYREGFLSELFSSLLIQHLELLLDGNDEDFLKDARSFASLLERSERN